MSLTHTLSAAVLAGVLAFPASALSTLPSTAQQAAGGLKPADAGPFLGDWTLELQGPNGPGIFQLAVKVENDKVVGEIGNDQMPSQPITDVRTSDKSLVLSYSFLYEGMNVDAVVSLTPDAEGKTAASIDFAGGAYVMSGTATKKTK